MKRYCIIISSLMLVTIMMFGLLFTVEAKDVEINYLSWRGTETHPELMLYRFEESNPGIKVNFQIITTGNYIKSQKVRFLSNDSIDLTEIRPESITEYIEADYLLDLSGQDFLANYPKDTLSRMTRDGKVYGIPTAVNIIGVWYNKDMFEERGIEIPHNLSEYFKVLDTFKKEGIYPLASGGKDGWPMELNAALFIQKLLVENPDIFAEVDTGKVKYTDHIFLKLFRDIDNFYKSGYIDPNILSYSHSQAEQLFIQGRVPIFVQGEWEGPTIKEGNPDFEVGVFPLPVTNEKGEVVVPISVGSYMSIANPSSYKEEDLKLLEFMSSEAGAQYYVDNLASFSPVKGVSFDNIPYGELWTKMFDYQSRDFFYTLQYPGANSELIKCLQELFLRIITPEEMAERLQAAQDQK